MSLGSIIGGGLGAVIGGLWGGLPGAYIGWTIGFGVGAMIDPLTPDMPVPGQPELGNINISTADEGLPIKDVLGTTKISSGNILWYGAQHVVEITEEVETGGKGGGGTETVHKGWEFYVSWALGLCMGPADTLYTVFNGDDVVWSGELNRPLAGGEETIVLAGMGSMTFYFGTADQIANATLTSKLTDATLNPAYRHQCYAFFNDCSTGQYERIPTMKFVLRKKPTFAFNANETIQTYDYNAAHAVYYILNTLLEIPASTVVGEPNYLNAASFSNAADTLFTENRGVSMLFGSQSDALTYLGESLLAHVDGIIRWGNDGKFHLKLIRADEAVVDLPSFDENDMLDTLELSRKSWYDTKNEIKVQYSERIYLECLGAGDAGPIPPTCDPANPAEINFGEELEISIIDGCSPFTWTVIGGTGLEFAEGDTSERTNTILIIDPCETGDYTMIITDLCGNSVNCPISYPAGPAFDWDGGNPVVIAQGGSISISVTGGIPPFYYFADTVGFNFDPQNTDERTSTLIADTDVCSENITIRVTDACGTTISAPVTCTVPPVAWDDAGSDDTIDREGEATVAVSGGSGPFAWSVTGTGFSFDDPTTDERTNTLSADDTACGTATITVTDNCGDSCTGYVRGTEGQWNLIDGASGWWDNERCAEDPLAYGGVRDGYTIGNTKWVFTGLNSYQGVNGSTPYWRSSYTGVASVYPPPCGSPEGCFDIDPPPEDFCDYRVVSSFNYYEWGCPP